MKALALNMKLLELFAGSRSVGRVAERLGFEVFSVDIEAFDGIDLVKDIETLMRSDIPFVPDVIWASPPCTTYSLAAISHHRHSIIPISDAAAKADQVLRKTVEIFSWFPTATFYMENPVGMMRKMPEVLDLDRRTVDYCTYGDTRRKPTDIWTNNAVADEGGAIVLSSECSVMEIADARLHHRMFVDDQGIGFVRRSQKWLDNAKLSPAFASVNTISAAD